jgi:hypothetical protein
MSKKTLKFRRTLRSTLPLFATYPKTPATSTPGARLDRVRFVFASCFAVLGGCGFVLGDLAVSRPGADAGGPDGAP